MLGPKPSALPAWLLPTVAADSQRFPLGRPVKKERRQRSRGEGKRGDRWSSEGLEQEGFPLFPQYCRRPLGYGTLRKHPKHRRPTAGHQGSFRTALQQGVLDLRNAWV